jgi:hypothetical protein
VLCLNELSSHTIEQLISSRPSYKIWLPRFKMRKLSEGKPQPNHLSQANPSRAKAS